MPELSHRWIWQWIWRWIWFCALGLLAASCSSKKTASGPEPPPSAEVTASLQREAVRQARIELDKGEELAHGGQWSEARHAFDRAVDFLLDIPGGFAASPESESLFNDIIATIQETERGALDADAQEQFELAAVDELTREALEELPEDIGEAAVDADLPTTTYDIPIDMNARVRSIIEMYQLRRHDWFQEALDRSGYYRPMIAEIFAEEDMPQDLLYLAMVESAFNSRAMSRAGARGIWQFIRGTGRRYDLRQDFWVDDRFNPEKASRAAARHLKDLYEQFGDWYLVMAAYNSGSRRVERAIRRTGSRDFWVHAKRRVLPRETRSYVPLILAAIVIAKNPEAYGFDPPTTMPLEYDVERVEYPVDLATAAKSAGVSVEDMKFLNPELRRWVTPLDSKNYALRIPKGTSEVFRAALANIPEAERVRFGTHVVRRGDTLSQIASRYGTTVNALTAANNISRRSLIHPGQVLTVPVPPGTGAQRIRAVQRREAVAENGQEVYVVQRGDTLGEISTSFSMSLRALRELNGFRPRSTRIYPGQRLIVTEQASRKMRSASISAPAPSATDIYIVQTGDTLGHIAEAHGLGLSVLRRLNGFSSRRTRIYAGQRLRVRVATAVPAEVSTSGATRYRIRRGDTLSTIARRFGVTVEEIRRWNQMGSDRIVAGERLTIYVQAGTN